MSKQKSKFPYQIHIILGLIWILIGVFLQSGFELVFWVAVGVVMLIVGLFSKGK